MVHSDTIRNDVLDVGTDETILKAKTQNGALCLYLKRFLGSWNTWEHFEIKDDVWCILTLFEMMFLKLEMLRKF